MMVRVGPQEHNPSSFSPGEDGAEQGCPHPATPGAIKHLVMEGDRDSKPPSNVTAFWCSLAKRKPQPTAALTQVFYPVMGFFPLSQEDEGNKEHKGRGGRTAAAQGR